MEHVIVILKFYDTRFDIESVHEFVCISLNAAKELCKCLKKDFADWYVEYIKISIHKTFWDDDGVLNTGETIYEEYIEIENEEE